MSSKENRKTSFLKSFSKLSLFSQAAGLTTITSLNFLEVTKIRLITDVNKCMPVHYNQKTTLSMLKKYMMGKTVPDIAKACTDCLPFRNSFLSMHHILRSEGAKVFFFSGVNKTMISYALKVGLYFPTFEFIKARSKHLFNENNRELRSSQMGSVCSRSFVSIISFPFEVAKVVSQGKVKESQKKKIWYNIKDIAINPKKYDRIFLNYFLRELGFSLTFWTILEMTKAYLSKYHSDVFDTEFKRKVASAGVGGFFGALMTFPFDVIQTNKLLTKFPENMGIVDMLKFLKAKHGWGFFKNGLFVRVFKGSITTCMFFTLYENFKIMGDTKEF